MTEHKSVAIDIVECLSQSQTESAYRVMNQLRTHLSVQQYLERVQRAMKSGYRLFSGSQAMIVVAVIGFRIQEDLCWGRNLYVDDLVVDMDHRRKGIGTTMMMHVEKIAKQSNCDYIRLASGLSKLDAHLFYEAIGYKKTSYAFGVQL